MNHFDKCLEKTSFIRHPLKQNWCTMNDLIGRIADGTVELLGIDEICSRLSVSRPTSERWVRNGSNKPADKMLSFGQIASSMDRTSNFFEGSTSFPPPDIRIGGSPKWKVETLKKWLRFNTGKGD